MLLSLGMQIAAQQRAAIFTPPPGMPEGASYHSDFVNGQHWLINRRYPEPMITGRQSIRSGAYPATRPDGVLLPFAPNVPRIVPGQGMRVLGGAIRVSQHPQTQTDWSNSNATITTLEADASGFVWRRIASTGALGHRQLLIFSDIRNAGETVWCRVRYRASTDTPSGRVRVEFRNITASTSSVIAGDLTAPVGTFSAAGTINNLVISDFGGGLYEASFAVTLAANGTSFNIGLGPDSVTAGQSVEFGGAQVTTAFADWITASPETTATVGASEYALTDLAALGLTPAVLAAGFTVVVGYIQPFSGFEATIFELTNNTNNEVYRLRRLAGGNNQLVVRTGGVAQVDSGVGTAVSGVNRQAIRFAVDDVGWSLNGASPGSDSSVALPSPDRLVVGSSLFGIPLNSSIRAITIIPTPVDNATLQALSGS